MSWPAQDFSLVRSADKNFWIRVFSSGREMPPTRTIGMEECPHKFVWSERKDVMDGQPDDIFRGITKSGQSGECV